MEKLGIVIKWIASKAYGFLKPLDRTTGQPTGNELFMHIRAADDPSIDITENLRVMYKEGFDNRGRQCAIYFRVPTWQFEATSTAKLPRQSEADNQTDRTAAHPASTARAHIASHDRRRRGWLTTWNADRGFGFIDRDDGKESIFAHVDHFQNGEVPPVNTEVYFTPAWQARKGKDQATNIVPNYTDDSSYAPPGSMEQLLEDTRDYSVYQGTMKCYDKSKSFGFITPNDGGEDIFVHRKEIDPNLIQLLTQGGSHDPTDVIEVEYRYFWSKHHNKYQAYQVRRQLAPQPAPPAAGSNRGNIASSAQHSERRKTEDSPLTQHSTGESNAMLHLAARIIDSRLGFQGHLVDEFKRMQFARGNAARESSPLARKQTGRSNDDQAPLHRRETTRDHNRRQRSRSRGHTPHASTSPPQPHPPTDPPGWLASRGHARSEAPVGAPRPRWCHHCQSRSPCWCWDPRRFTDAKWQ